MCGIVGFTGAPDPGLLGRMQETIRHRGPDDEGAFQEDGISLGMRRLAILDPEHGRQPTTDAAGDVICVFNGEIYNFLEIRRALEEDGVAIRTRCDSEILPHLYRGDPGELVAGLDGMFAIALWDRRRRRLVLARDPVGEKPLYHVEIGGRFAFASEVKALLLLPGLVPAVDRGALSAYLELGYVPGPGTLFAGISKLEPGTLLVRDRDGRIRTQRYASLPWPAGAIGLTTPETGNPAGPSAVGPTTPGMGDAGGPSAVGATSTGRSDPGPAVASQAPGPDIRGVAPAAAALCEQVDRAVRSRMIADVPVGCFLSGGLDSSIVAAHMALASPHRVRTFSVGFPDAGDLDERSHARIVADHLGTDHTEILVGPPTLDDLLRLTRMADFPLANPAVIPTHRLAEVARRDVKVVLTGEGADELFAGYGKYFYPLVAGKLPGPLARLGGLALGALPLPGRLGRYGSKLADVLAGAGLDERFERVNAIFDREARRALLRPEGGAGALPGATAGWPCRLGARVPWAPADPLAGMMAFDLTGYLPEDNLMKLDRATMACSLEGRSPFVAPALVAFARSLPHATRLAGGRPKGLLRRAFASMLPPDILARPKHAFDVPIGRWLEHDLAGLVERLLDPGLLARQGLFDPAAVALLRRPAPGTPDPSRVHRRLWILVAFQLWYATFIDGALLG